MSISDDEIVKDYFEAYEKLKERGIKLTSYLYKADIRISEYLDELNELSQKEKLRKQEIQQAGKLLEQIVVLVFKGLKGDVVIYY